MRTKQKCESYTAEAPIIIKVAYKDLVSQVNEEVLVKDTAEIETSKKSKEKTKQCYINHI
jgi:hypothetical protein